MKEKIGSKGIFPTRLKKTRMDRGLTQKQLGEKEHGYGTKRTCAYCIHATKLSDTILCHKKSEAKAGSVVKPNHSCNLWEEKK